MLRNKRKQLRYSTGQLYVTLIHSFSMVLSLQFGMFWKIVNFGRCLALLFQDTLRKYHYLSLLCYFCSWQIWALGNIICQISFFLSCLKIWTEWELFDCLICVGEMESGLIQCINRNKDKLMVRQNFMVGLIAATNEILCFARGILFFKVFAESSKEMLDHEFFKSYTRHIWKHILENGKFERLNVFKSLNAKFQNYQMSVWSCWTHKDARFMRLQHLSLI